MSYRELLIGCGHDRRKRLDPKEFLGGPRALPGSRLWQDLETLDHEKRATPDILWDLDVVPWSRTGDEGPYPLAADTYDEIHAYEVLEHLGRLGDYLSFFETFSEIWRLLKPGGLFCATCPSRYSEWLWGDPGHTRAILPGSLVFLNQPQYSAQLGQTAMSDYRSCYRADFDTLRAHDNHETFWFVLQAVKPSRWEGTT
jgi:hypothetical protein